MVSVTEQNLEEDVREIKEKISQIQMDIASYITAVHNQDLDLIFQNIQTNFIHTLTSQLSTEADKLLNQNMMQNCEMHKTCKNNFKQLLTEQTNLLNKKTVTKEDLEEKYDTLETLRKNGTTSKKRGT